MVRLVAVAQPAQDLHRLVGRRLLDAHLLEAPLERGVALQVLAVLVERRRADRLQLAAGERRLQDRGCVDRALGGAGADEVVELVDEQDDVAALGDLLHHLLQALLELAAVLRAGHERGEVERVDLPVLEQLGHLVRRDARREALDDGGLADARLADQHRVVLLAARQDLHHALDLGLAPDDGVELALGGGLGQVAPELVEQLRALRLLAGRRARALLAPARAGEHADDLVADLLSVGVEVEQDAGGDTLVLAHQPEQDVLGADVVVAERERLAQRELEHLLRARRERDLTGRDLVALADDAGHLGAHLLDGDVELLEHARGKALLLAQQAEQDVLRADVVVLQRPCFVLREDDDLPGPFRESLEHRSFDPPFRIVSGVPVIGCSGSKVNPSYPTAPVAGFCGHVRPAASVPFPVRGPGQGPHHRRSRLHRLAPRRAAPRGGLGGVGRSTTSPPARSTTSSSCATTRGFHLVVDSVLSPAVVNELVHKCDVVYHLAAAVGVRLIVEQPVHTIVTNLEGTEVVLDHCSRFGKRVLVASTSEVYGDHRTERAASVRTTGASTGRPRRSAGCTPTRRRWTSTSRSRYHQERELDCVIARLFNTVGPRQSGQYGMVVPRFVQAALAGDAARDPRRRQPDADLLPRPATRSARCAG